MKQVAVTGGTGFVGQGLVQALVQRAVPVRMLVRTAAAAQDVPGIERYTGCLTRPDDLAGLVDNVDTLFHLAGYAHASSRPYPDELDKHRRINLQGSLDLFEAARAAGVRRIVFVSSVKAIGEHHHDCLDEQHTRPPQDPYGAIKREIEERLFALAAQAGMELIVLRPALVYGPGVKGNLHNMLRAIDRGRFPPVPDTHNVRSMVSRDDLVRALLLAAEAAAAGQAIVITDGEAYSTRRIYTAMAAALGRSVPHWCIPAAVLRGLG